MYTIDIIVSIVYPPPHTPHGRVAVLDIHSHGEFEPSDVESVVIPVGKAEDYTISTHDFISPVYRVHHFNTAFPSPTRVQHLLTYLPIQNSAGRIIWGLLCGGMSPVLLSY